MKPIDYSKVDVRIDIDVAGKPFKQLYAGAPAATEKDFQEWKNRNGDFFFERYGYYPNDGQRIAFICSDAACAYGEGDMQSFKEVAEIIAIVAHNLGFLDKGKLIIHVIKSDPNSDVVQTMIDKVSAEQFVKGGA